MLSEVANSGRPNYPVNLNVRMTVELLQDLDKLARDWGVSISETARRCMAYGVDELEGTILLDSMPAHAPPPDER